VLDDLRQGKRTMLMLTALQAADRSQRTVLERALGNPEADAAMADDVRAVVTDSGALATIEHRIEVHHDEALRAIAQIDDPAHTALLQLAARALFRDA
jgi:geranylgeranyl diphosphate synthase type I